MNNADDLPNMLFDPQIRELNALALAWAQHHVSSQTTYLHFNYHQVDEEVYQTIPVYENILYAYSLFKTKTAESVTEAKRVLKGILQFQNANEPMAQGNFPVYLHEYPLCKDRQYGVHLLPVFYWILSQFRQVLGSELEQELRERSETLLIYCRKTHSEKRLPMPLAAKLAASMVCFGKIFKNSDLQQEGERLLKEICSVSGPMDWFSPLHLSDFLIALQLTESGHANPLWDRFWQFVDETYHRATGSYVGPAFYEFQWKESAQILPYHFYMAYFTGAVPKRLQDPESPALYASLIQPSPRSLSSHDQTVTGAGECDGRPWRLVKNEELGVSGIDAQGNKLDVNWKGLIPFKMCWGSVSEPHSLIAQGGNYADISTSLEGASLAILEYEMANEFDLEDKDRRREVILAVDRSSSLRLRVNGLSATTFTLDDVVEIMDGNSKITLKFSLIKGEGQFMGHLMPGNRACQLALKNDNRYNAYDMLIFLRTLRRSEQCRVRVEICQMN